jgi:hypothetical protein
MSTASAMSQRDASGSTIRMRFRRGPRVFGACRRRSWWLCWEGTRGPHECEGQACSASGCAVRYIRLKARHHPQQNEDREAWVERSDNMAMALACFKIE